MKVSLKRQLVVDRERLPAARCSAKWQMNVLGSGPLKVSRLARSHRFQASGFTRRRVTAGTLPVLELFPFQFQSPGHVFVSLVPFLSICGETILELTCAVGAINRCVATRGRRHVPRQRWKKTSSVSGNVRCASAGNAGNATNELTLDNCTDWHPNLLQYRKWRRRAKSASPWSNRASL